MANFKRFISVLLLVVMIVGVTGCLSSSGGKEKPDVVVNPDDGDNGDGGDDGDGGDNNDDTTVVYVPYNPNGNKAPKVTSFNTNDLNEAVVAQGQTVTFQSTGLDPEGEKVTIKYEATGGSFKGNVWTAPTTSGYYQVLAYAVDENGLESAPAVITIRVEKPEGQGTIRLSSVPKIIKGSDVKGKRPISIDEGETFNQSYNFILSTRTQDDNHTATVEITFEDPLNNHNFTFAATKGIVNLVSEETLGSNQYKLTVKYTAPIASAVGDDWNAPVSITVYNKSDVSDKDVITLPFIVNTPPTITNVQFRADSGASAQVIGLSDTAALDVTVTEPNSSQGDVLTYVFNIVNGSGTLNPTSTTLGWSDFTAPSTRQEVYINVQVIDSKGGMDQETFTAYVQDPMSILMAKDQTNTVLAAEITGALDTAAEDADLYEFISEEETNQFKIGYRALGTNYVKTPIANGANTMSASYDASVVGFLETGLVDFAQYYFTGAPEDAERADAVHSVLWKVLNANGEEIKGDNNTYLANSANLAGMTDKANGFDFAPDPNGADFLLKGGIKTIKATVTADMDSRSITDTVRMNTMPYIEYVNFNTEDDTGVLYDQTNGVQTVQVSRGQTLYMNIGVYDLDNSDFDPQTTDYAITKTSGFFVNQVGSDTGIPAANKPGIIIDTYVQDTEIDSFSTYNAAADANMATTSVDIAAIAKNNYNTRFSSAEFEIPEDATTDVATGLGQTYHYMLIHVTDGTGLAVDVAGDLDLDLYTVPYEMALTDPTDTAARRIRIGTVAGRTSYNRKLMFEVVDITGTGLRGKIKDLDTGVYWQNATGTELTFAFAGDGALTLGDIVDPTNSANNWLAIDVADAANWEAGDKVYFDTFANTVVLRYQIVDGPKVTGVNSMKYATIGDTEGTPVVVLGSVSSGTASVTITIPDSADGSITQGVDNDGDSVLNEVWQYIPPTQMNSLKEARLLITITEVGVENPKRTVFEHIIKLNYPPTITGVSADGASEGGNNEFWVLAGSKAIVAMNASISDLDENDRFKFEWYLQEGNTYGLMYTDGTYDITGLGETSGKYGNGRIDLQVSVRDFDVDGVEKTGYAYVPAILGINEAPRVRNMAIADGATNGTNAANPSTAADMNRNSDNDADFNDTHEFPNAELEFTFDTTLAANDEIEDAVEDENAGLNYEWYISSDAAGNTPLLNVGSFYVEPEMVNGVMTDRLHWIPNDTLRRSGGTYYVNVIVSDDKPGKAQGRTRAGLPVVITADATAPTPANGDFVITEVRDNGTNNVYGIGDQLRFRINLTTGTTGDVLKAVVDMSDIVSPGGMMVMTNPNESLHGIDYDYSSDYVEYVYTVQKPVTTAGGLDGAGPAAAVATYYDMFGNVTSAAALDLSAYSFDNIIDGLFSANTTMTQFANLNTGLADIGTVVDPGDELELAITASDDDTAGYTAASAKLTGLGFNNLSATDYNVTNAGEFTWIVSMGAISGAQYTNADTDIVLTAVITDDAGNEHKVEVTAAQLLTDLAIANMDLVRPQVYTANLYSYSYGLDGVVGGGDDQLIDSTGRVYTTLTSDIIGAGVNIASTAITDDDDAATAEIVVITFDKTMNAGSLSDRSIKVIRNEDSKDFSVGSAQGTTALMNVNYTHRQPWTDDPATNNRNTLFISLVDATDAGTSLARGTVVEILFTDNADATAGWDVAVDTNNIEVDTGLADFRVGRNALTW